MTPAIKFLSLVLLHQARLTGYIAFDKLVQVRGQASRSERKVESANKLRSC